jgi:hypothetical protein
MSAKDILGLIVRLCGLVLIADGFYSILFAAVQALTAGLPTRTSNPAFAIFGVIFSILGFIVVRKADRIENFCYKSDKKLDALADQGHSPGAPMA